MASQLHKAPSVAPALRGRARLDDWKSGRPPCAIAFLGHEVLHGAVVRGRLPVRLLGFICMLPFTLSPTLWTNWHNRVHHNNCAQVGSP